MRASIVIATAIAAPLLFGSSPSQAAGTDFPWCLKAISSDLAVDYCDFRTFEACYKARFDYGGSSYCFHNPVLFFPDENEKKQRKAPREQ